MIQQLFKLQINGKYWNILQANYVVMQANYNYHCQRERHFFQLNPPMLQSFIYLKLSVAGHLFLFAARTKRHFWSIRPGILLFLAVAGTQITATLITVYGILLPAISWQLAIFVWICSIEFIIVDFSIPIYNLLEHKGLIFNR